MVPCNHYPCTETVTPNRNSIIHTLPSFLSAKELLFRCRSLWPSLGPQGKTWPALNWLIPLSFQSLPLRHALIPLLAKTGSILLLECTIVYYLPINTYAVSTLEFCFFFFVNNARDMGIKVLVSQSLEAKLNIRINEH